MVRAHGAVHHPRHVRRQRINTAAQNTTRAQGACNLAKNVGLPVYAPDDDFEMAPITVENIRFYGADSQDIGYNAATPGVGAISLCGTQFRIRRTAAPTVNLKWGSTFEGITFYYPEQTKAAFDAAGFQPKVYPPTIHVDSNMTNFRIKDVG